MTHASIPLESAIIRYPAVVSLDAKLMDAMVQMSGASKNNLENNLEGNDLEAINTTGGGSEHNNSGSNYLVIVDDAQVVGLLTERDVVRFAAQQLPLAQLTLEDVLGHRLKQPPITVRELALTDLGVVLNLFQQHQLSHLPVLDERARLVGVISRESLQQVLSATLIGPVIADKTAPSELAAYSATEGPMDRQERAYAPLLDVLPVGILHTDLAGICTYASERYGEIFGLDPDALVGQSWSVGYSPELIERIQAVAEQAHLENRPWSIEYQVPRSDGSQTWVYGQSVKAYDAAGQEIGFIGTVTDISDRKRAESLLEDQYQILEKIAKAEPLQDIFQSFLTAMEKYLPETACSIILCQDGHLCHPFAPSLPKAYTEAVSASVVPIEEGIGSCGTAAYRRAMVISEDIDTDPLWPNFKHLVVPYGIKSCWSMPVFGRDQSVLAVFGIYSKEKRIPQSSDIEFVGKLTNLAGIAIEREQSTQALRQLNQELENRVEERTTALQASEERWQLALKGANEGIWDWNLQTNQFFASQRLKEIRGAPPDEPINTLDDYIKFIHPDERDQVSLAIEEHLAGASEFFESEFRSQHRDGHYIWMLCRAQAQRDDTGQAVRMIGSVTDITQRKTAEQELILKQNHLEALLNNLPHITWIKDEQSRFIAVNQPFAQVAGTTAEALVDKTDLDLWPVELAQAYRADDFQVLRSGQRKVVEEKVARADGTMGWLETTKTPFRDADGKLAGTVGIAADITDRKRIEAALAESEAKYRRLVEGGQELIWSTDEQGRFTYLSPQFKTLTGWEASEWIGKLCVEAVHPDDQERVAASHQALARDAVAGSVEFRLSHRNQSYCWVNVSYNPVFNAAGVLVGQQGTLTNINERKTAELALQASQEHLHRLTENIPGMIFRYVLHPDSSNEFTYVNPYVRELYEMEPEEILQHARSPWEIVHPDDVDFLASTIQQSAETLQPLVVEHRFIVPKGGLRWGQNIARPQRQDNGDVVWEGVSFDITDRKTAELALQASEAKYQRITESVPGVIYRYVLHPDGRDEFTYMSPQVQQLYELAPDDVLQNAQLIWDRVHPDDLLRVSEAVRVSAESLQPFSVEMRLRFPQERIKWVEAHSRPERHGNGDIVWDGVVLETSDRKQAEEKLAVLSERLNLAIESAEIGIWEWAIEDNILIWDDRMFALYGIAPEDFSGHYEDWLKLLHPEDVARMKEQEEAALREHGYATTEFRIVRPDGEVRFLYSNVSSLRNERGEVVRTIGLDMDITERKQAEIALEKEVLRRAAVFNASPDGIHIMDRSGNLVEANASFAQLLGYSLEEVSHLNVADWDAQWSYAELQDMLKNYPTDTYSTFETLHRRKDGVVFPVEITECSMEWNGEFALVCISRDISERKRAEVQLKRTNQELARATRLKDEFLANMSHELRTPLNAILGMTEGLQDEVFGQINAQQLKSLMTIEQSGSHLLELINEILDLAKIEAGNIELTYSAVSVTHLCQSSLTFVKQQSLEKGVQLHLQTPWDLPPIRVDERRIRQVLINLLNNAVKFTPSGGSVTLKVSPLQPDESYDSPGNTPRHNPYYLRFTVTDTGIGIDPDELNHLFQPFVQIDSALNRQYEGTGLGLALVKRIVELHRGHITVTSEVGVGSCFVIELPYDAVTLDISLPETSPALSSPASSSPALSGAAFSGAELPKLGPLEPLEPPADSPLILIAEDNEANIVTLSSYLQAKGYRILVATNGKAAIELAQAKRPNAILMDIQMPDMDGLSAIQCIRQLPGLQQVPIIALTALAMEGDQARCLAAGADKYLSKPVKLKQLALSIQELIT
ncbi:MAG: PAS domain S-box protein [Cyanobacteria bacterium P01_F01_bin.86]